MASAAPLLINTDFSAAIARNKRNTVILIAVLVLIAAILGYVLGWAWGILNVIWTLPGDQIREGGRREDGGVPAHRLPHERHPPARGHLADHRGHVGRERVARHVGRPAGGVAVPAQIREHEAVGTANRDRGRDELVAGSGQPVQRHHDRPVTVAFQVAEPDLVVRDLAAPEPGIHDGRLAPGVRILWGDAEPRVCQLTECRERLMAVMPTVAITP